MQKTGIWTALKFDFEDVTKNLDQAHNDYKEAKKHADVWRNDFLESLAEAKAMKKRHRGSYGEKEAYHCVQAKETG